MAAATSSIEQIDIVESAKGTPNASAACAARISPSGCCMPVRPVGASATGIATGWPTMSEARVRSVMSTSTRWRSRILAKSSWFAR